MDSLTPALRQRLPKFDGRVLRSLVRMVNDPFRPASPDRHVQGIDHQLGPQVGCHRPAHHAAAEGIHHYGQIQKPRPGPDVGNIGNPELVRPVRRKVTIHQIRGSARPPLASDASSEFAGVGSPPPLPPLSSDAPPACEKHTGPHSPVRLGFSALHRCLDSNDGSSRSGISTAHPPQLEPRVDAGATHSTHWGKHPALGTS